MTDTTRRVASSEKQPESSRNTITTPDEHEDFPGQLLVTRDQRTIMEWARERGAEPVAVPRGGSADRLDELRLDVRGESHEDEGMPVSWDQWMHVHDC